MTQPVSTNAIQCRRKNARRGQYRFCARSLPTTAPGGGQSVLSPYSVSTALGMTCPGRAGDVETQMADALHLLLPQEALHPAFAKLEALLRDIQANGDVQLKRRKRTLAPYRVSLS